MNLQLLKLHLIDQNQDLYDKESFCSIFKNTGVNLMVFLMVYMRIFSTIIVKLKVEKTVDINYKGQINTYQMQTSRTRMIWASVIRAHVQ